MDSVARSHELCRTLRLYSTISLAICACPPTNTALHKHQQYVREELMVWLSLTAKIRLTCVLAGERKLMSSCQSRQLCGSACRTNYTEVGEQEHLVQTFCHESCYWNVHSVFTVCSLPQLLRRYWISYL